MNEFPAARRSTHRCLAQNPLHWREHPTLAPLYNGNISSAVYTQQPMGPWGSTATEGDAMAGIYHYDQLNRLKSMATRQGITAAANNWATIPAPTSLKAYMSQYTYDGNGNILTVQRQDGNGNTYDSLLYHYKKSGAQLLQNRLYHLQDLADHNNSLVNPGAGEQAQDIGYDNSAYMDAAFEAVEQDNNYRYDALGNLVKDRREGIDTITWTVAGKVAAVVHASSPDSLKFTYGADGQRTSKTLGDPEQGGYREYYIRDAQGNIMAVYLYKALGTSSTLLLQDRPIYGSKRVGSYGEAEEMLSGPLPPNYAHPMLSALLKYELTDHLGNVRATVSGELIPSANSASMYEPHLLSETDYEPFGSLLPGRNFNSDSYRFGFNGKENDNEVYGSTGTFQDYGMRAYDTRLGRFISVDPLSAKYPFYTPYQFAGNKPIWAVDLDGLEEYFRTDYRDATGALYKTIINMVSNNGANEHQQTVYHSVMKANNDGTFSPSYLGFTKGTTTGTNAFDSPSPELSNTQLANNMRQTAMHLTSSNAPVRTPMPPTLINVGTVVNTNGTRRNVQSTATSYELTPAAGRDIGFVKDFFDQSGTHITSDEKIYGPLQYTFGPKDSPMYNGSTPKMDGMLGGGENAVESDPYHRGTPNAAGEGTKTKTPVGTYLPQGQGMGQKIRP